MSRREDESRFSQTLVSTREQKQDGEREEQTSITLHKPTSKGYEPSAPAAPIAVLAI